MEHSGGAKKKKKDFRKNPWHSPMNGYETGITRKCNKCDKDFKQTVTNKFICKPCAWDNAQEFEVVEHRDALSTNYRKAAKIYPGRD